MINSWENTCVCGFCRDIYAVIRLNWQQCYGCGSLYKSKKWNIKCYHRNSNRWSKNLACNQTNVCSLSPLQLIRLVINCWLLRLLSFKNIENDTFDSHFLKSRCLKLSPISNKLSDLLVISHLIIAKNSRYLDSRYLEFLLMLNKFSDPLSSFFALFQTFSKTFCKFSTQIRLFQFLLAQLLQLCR